MRTLEDLIRKIMETDALCKKYFGVTRSDFYTKRQLRGRYYQLIKLYHPDGDNGSDEITKEINNLYEMLKPFAKNPEDKEYAFHNEHIKTLKSDFEYLFKVLNYSYSMAEYGKKGARLAKNRKKIIEQIKPIYEVLIDKFQIIDVYLCNNPKGSVAKHIEQRIHELADRNLYCRPGTNRLGFPIESDISKAANQFYYAYYDYKSARHGTRGALNWGDADRRNDMRKYRNEALVELLKFSKEMQKFLLMMNNGLVYPPDDDAVGLMNLTYMADVERLNRQFTIIRHSGNYYCYITPAQREELEKAKIKRREKDILHRKNHR